MSGWTWAPTFGGFSQFPPASQRELLDGLGAAIDAAGGSFVMGYTAVVATAVRAGHALTGPPGSAA